MDSQFLFFQIWLDIVIVTIQIPFDYIRTIFFAQTYW